MIAPFPEVDARDEGVSGDASRLIAVVGDHVITWDRRSLTVNVNVTFVTFDPAALLAEIVYTLADATDVGVPVSRPVLVENESPAGAEGDIK